MHAVTVAVSFTESSLWWYSQCFEAWLRHQELLKKPHFSLSQTTCSYRQLNRRSTLGHTDNPNLIFLILPLLLLSQSTIQTQTSPNSVSPSEAETALSSTLYPHPFVFLQSHYLSRSIHWLFFTMMCDVFSFFWGKNNIITVSLLSGIQRHPVEGGSDLFIHLRVGFCLFVLQFCVENFSWLWPTMTMILLCY